MLHRLVLRRKMIHFYLIRHGECLANTTAKECVVGRASSSPLTQKGMDQSLALLKHLDKENIKFDKVLVSTAERALRTAFLAIRNYQNVEILEELEEMSQGEWEGKERSKVHTLDVLQAMNADNYNFSAPGGESAQAVEGRMFVIIMDLIKQYESSPKDTHIAIFGHGMTFKCLLRSILGSSPKMTHKIQLDNTSITELGYNSKGWNIIRVNDTRHLYTK